MSKKTVVVGLSGGVDSSVAALLLKQQGWNVIGLFMKNWEDDDDDEYCSSRQDLIDVMSVADTIGIDVEVVNFAQEYRERVFAEFLREYQAGRTPNPDILCNSEIKFKAFLDHALTLGADKIATGHYAGVREFDGKFQLLKAEDGTKDQSYFLCQLSQEQLRYALFPVGALLKPEVRRIAAEQGLATAKRKDSQGICFVGKIDLPAFLQQKLASKRGNVHEILPTWPKYGPKARIPAGTPDAGQAIPAPASPAAGHSAPMSSANTPAANTPAGIGQTVTSPASKPISAAGRPDGDPHSPGGQHAADVPPTTEQLAALAAPWRYTVRDGKKIGEHGGAHFYTIGQRKGLGIGGRKESLFILATDTVQNVIYVGEGDSHPGLWRQALHIAPREIHWVNPARTMPAGHSARFSVRIRYRQPLQEATLNASVPLRQTYWKLIELVDGADLAAPADGADAAHLVLARDSDRAMGSGGCNRFAARYQVDGGQLRFDALVSGLRLCLQGGTSELAYLERLDAVRAYWQQGRSLELRDRAGKPVLRFVAEERGEPPPDDDEPPLQPS